MDYYSALKGKDILRHAARCMNLENTVPNGIHQSQKDNSRLSLLIGGSWSSHIPRDEKSEEWLLGAGGRPELRSFSFAKWRKS